MTKKPDESVLKSCNQRSEDFLMLKKSVSLTKEPETPGEGAGSSREAERREGKEGKRGKLETSQLDRVRRGEGDI